MAVTNQVCLCQIQTQLSVPQINFLQINYLADAEMAISHAIGDPLQQATYMQSHAFKKKVLSDVLQRPPLSFNFYNDAFGKPFLSPNGELPVLSFNLSHTTGMVALIVGHEKHLGIDIEKSSLRSDFDLLAKEIFNEEDKQLQLSEETATDHFFKIWTIKEAFLKGKGTGFIADPQKVLINPLGDDPDLYEVEDGAFSCRIQYQKHDDFALAFTSYSNTAMPIKHYTFQNDFCKC